MPVDENILNQFKNLQTSLESNTINNISITDCKFTHETFFSNNDTDLESVCTSIQPIQQIEINYDDTLNLIDIDKKNKENIVNTLKSCVFSSDSSKSQSIEDISNSIHKNAVLFERKSNILSALIEFKNNTEMLYSYHIARYTFYNEHKENITKYILDKVKNTNDLIQINKDIELNEKLLISSVDKESIKETLSKLNKNKQKTQNNLSNIISYFRKTLGESLFYNNDIDFDSVSNTLYDSIKNKTINLSLNTKNYSEILNCVFLNDTFNSLQKNINGSNLFSFNFDFIKKDLVLSTIIDTNIKNSYDNFDKKILNGDINTLFSVNYKNIDKKDTIKGVLYEKFYNLLSNPIDNFFTLEERGLSLNINDAVSVKSEFSDDITHLTVKNNESDLYIKDLSAYSLFYNPNDSTFVENLQKKIDSYFEINIKPVKDRLISQYEELALIESKYILLKNDIKSTPIEYSKHFISKYKSLLDCINNLQLEIADLKNKLSTDTIKKELQSCECVGTVKNDTIVPQKIDLVNSFLTPTGTDPSNPHPHKQCYWVVFAKLATQYGLLPFPDINKPTSLRYWDVGMLIPNPSGIIKIPLPTIWIPIITISSPMGLLVLFIGQIGILPCPYLLWVSNDGSKKFLITLRGMSDVFGSNSENESSYKIKDLYIKIPKIDIPNLNIDDFLLSKLNLYKTGFDFNIDDEFEYILNMINKSLNSIPFPDIDIKSDINKKYISDLITDYISNIDIPSIYIPSNVDSFTTLSELDSILSELKNMMNIGGINLEYEFELSLTDLIRNGISNIKYDLDINNILLDEIPDIIEFNNIEHLDKIKNLFISIIDKVISKININVLVDQDKIKALTSIVVNVFECHTEISTSDDSKLMDIINNLCNPIYDMLNNIDYNMLYKLSFSSSINKNQLLSMFDSLLYNNIPNIPLPDGNIPKYDDFSKILTSFMLPKIEIKADVGMPKLKQINFDFNNIKNILIDNVIEIIDEYILDYPNVTSLEIKQYVIEIINSKINGGLDYIDNIKKSYELMIKSLTILKSIKDNGIEFNILESIMNPIDVAKKIAKISPCLIDYTSCKPSSDDIKIVDEDKLQKAVDLLKRLSLFNYIVIGSICAFVGDTGKDMIRSLHPLISSDDLPPYERLTLDNMLFVLFLDDFCYNAKKYGGFYEEFI